MPFRVAGKINQAFAAAAEGPLRSIMRFSEQPLFSRDVVIGDAG
jgi:hypothetical protein